MHPIRFFFPPAFFSQQNKNVHFDVEIDEKHSDSTNRRAVWYERDLPSQLPSEEVGRSLRHAHEYRAVYQRDSREEPAYKYYNDGRRDNSSGVPDETNIRRREKSLLWPKHTRRPTCVTNEAQMRESRKMRDGWQVCRVQ